MITVVIPTHNRIALLKNTLRSVFRQSLSVGEVIVVDDGSQPAVEKIIFDDFPVSVNCILFRNENPKGANFSRNMGVNLAKGRYIAFLDDDDTWEPSKLALQFQLMESQNLDLTYTGKRIITVGVNEAKLSERYSYVDPKFIDLQKSIMSNNFIGTTSCIMVKKASFEKTGGFNNEMPALQDYEFYIRFIDQGYSVKGINEPLVNYFIYNKKNSISKDLNKILKGVYRIICNNFYKKNFTLLLYKCTKILLVKLMRSN